MSKQKPRSKRVSFDIALHCNAIAADGTWTFEGQLEDISAMGARVHLFGQLDDRVRSQEFFLLMTPCGKVKRRAKLIWKKNQRLGLRFIGSSAEF